MKTANQRIQYGLIAAIILIIGSATFITQSSRQSFPNFEEYSHEPIELRRYKTPVLPRDNTDLRARINQFMWRTTKRGQAKLFESAQLSGATDMKSAFESIGYHFPSGTSVSNGGCSSPGWRIRHHPSVLDHMERYLKLERIP
jgi:hypothetical protein